MSLSSESFMQEIEDRCIIDIMKENMLNERGRNEEFINFLKGQVDNYTVEISHKKQISSLLKLLEKKQYWKLPTPNGNHPSKHKFWSCTKESRGSREDVQLNEMYTNDDDDIINNPPNDTSLLNESIENNNNFKEIDNKWITQRKKKRNNTVSLKRYR